MAEKACKIAGMAKPAPKLSPDEIQRVIATAFEDSPPYTKVLLMHGIGHGELVALLKRQLTPAAYKLWAARGRTSKGPTKKATWPHGR
jgi:uncharacterized protein (TIGR03643 family)